MSTSMFNRRRASNCIVKNPATTTTIKHRITLATIEDEDLLDPICDSVSTEPSLANSSVSNVSTSTPNGYESYDMSNTYTTSRQPLHADNPLISNSSLLDMTRGSDDSHDDDNNVSVDAVNKDASYRSPDTSLLDDDDDDDHEHEHEHEHGHEEGGDAVTVMERSIANLSASLSGSFCTRGDEVGFMDCRNLSDKISQKVHFSDKIIQDRVMKDLNYLLGSTTNPCCMEKGLFSDCFGSGKTTTTLETTLTSVEAKIRNRAGESWRARAYRIKRLREEKMIQDSSWRSTIMKSGNISSGTDDGISWEDNTMARSTSFGHKPFSVPNSMNAMKPMQEFNVEPLGCMIGDCIEPISSLESNDVEVDRQEYIDEQDLCYDSDPGISSNHVEQHKPDLLSEEKFDFQMHERSKSETFSSNVQSSTRKKWFRSPRRRRRKMHFDSFDDLPEVGKAHNERDEALDLIRADFYGNGCEESESESFDESHIPIPLSKRANNNFIDKEIQFHVQDALNETWTLTWHPPPSTESNPKSSKNLFPSSSASKKSVNAMTPRCVQLWFERGNRVRRNDIVEPKLMWRDAYHPDLASQRKLNLSTLQGPRQICLLSICRIVEARKMDKKKYPFAKTSCSFIIRTSDDEEFIFETINQKARDQLVYAWKLVVARLASQAVVGDGEGMVGEFFVPSSFGVQ